MQESRGVAAGSRWREWVIAVCIAALAIIGVTAIWGGSIRRWIDSSSESLPAKGADQVRGASGSRL
jgi:hypothetical protein